MGNKKIFKRLAIGTLLAGGVFMFLQSFSDREIPPVHAKNIILTDNRLSFVYEGRSEMTVREFLTAEDIETVPEDFIAPSLGESLSAGTNIIIERAKPLAIAVDGGIKKMNTHARTVGDAIEEAGIVLEDDDMVAPRRDTLVTPELEVKITRVEIREEQVERPIAYSTKTEEDDELSWRTKKVKTKGEEGIRQITYRVSYHDGEEVGRKQIESTVTAEPVTEVVVQGTHVKVGKKHEGLGTWYAHTGTLAAASPWLPMGSYARVTNEANGKSVIVVINDRGPFGPNRIIDLDKVAFEKIASIGAGIINVKVEEVTN